MVRSRPVHTHAISRVPSGNASGLGLTVRLLVKVRAPAAGRLPLTAMSEEQGREELLPR